VINPPFWDTLWARILELLLLAMIVYYVYYRVKTRIEKKQNEDRLRFFANISYNIRTPLTLIKSPIGELKNSLPSTSKTDYLLDLMSENVDKLTRLFSVFVGLHNAYNNAEQLQLSKVDISQLLLSKVEFFAVKAARRNLKLSTDKVVRNLEEWTDELKLQQIIDNLLAMAIEHSSSDSLIAVGLACRTSQWSISFRAKCVPGQSRLRKLTTYDSTYLHQYIVLLNGDFSSKRHGDEITYSVSFYRGTEHYKNYVLLDSTEKTNILTDADISADVEVDRKYRPTLLVIEEDVDMGKVLVMSLADSYIVRIVTAGKNIWEEVVTVNPDIVICDLDMSEADGLDLCHRIKDSYETSHIAVVIMTMIDDSRVKQQAFNEGIDAYIEKPFDLDYLRSRINNIINNRNLLRRKFLGADNLQALVGSRKDDSVKRFMNNVQQILDKHLTDPKFSVNDFLIEMNLSRTLLYSKFRAVTGYAPNEFIKIMRMKKAVEYLNTHQYTINQISYMVGFEEPAYFSTCFKKVYGKSPRQFMDENGCGKVTDIADDMDES
uniref:hybrid sensor histidine kinase/response regulator transcription factor n=1 Tax=Segatella oris TaxID=28135 RepID=UPI0028D6139B